MLTGEPEKPSIPALNRVIASVNIRLPGCIVLRSSWGKVLIRLPFRVVGLDISESPRRSIVLGPRVALQPFPSPLSSPAIALPPLSSSFLRLSRFNSLESLYLRSVSSVVLSFRARESSRPEVIRCLEGVARGGCALSRWGF